LTCGSCLLYNAGIDGQYSVLCDTEGSVPMADRIDRIGQQFGEYRLLRWLGGGGFGDVYLGQQVRDYTLAAVKVLQARLTDSKELKEFINEARTFRLKHPHIVPLLDFGIGADDIPFLVMMYAPNGTLRDRHPKGSRLPLSTVLAYVTPIAAALQYAHDLHLVHRDVKPENMLVGPNHEILLSDFGIATVAHSSRSLNIQEDIGGTLPYMAPEQIAGKTGIASDRYALGVVVYEWLCGTRPFKGTAAEVAMQHTMMPPPSLRERVPTLSVDVEQIVLRALAKDPKQRFASVQEFANALQRAAQPPSSYPALPAQNPMTPLPAVHSLAQAAPIQGQEQQSRETLLVEIVPQTEVALAPPDMAKHSPATVIRSRHTTSSHPRLMPSSLPDPSRTRLSRRTMLLVGAGVTGMTILGMVYFAFSLGSSPLQTAAPGPTPPPRPLLLRTPLFTYTGHSAPITSLAWSPDGKRIASASLDGMMQVWDAVRGGSALFTYTDYSPRKIESVPVWTVAWSPDSKYIATGSADRTAQVWDAVHGGSALIIYKGHSGEVNAVKWSPNGTRIVSGSADYTVQVWDAVHGGSALVTYSDYSAPVTGVAWSPDGKRIVAGSRDKTVQVWDATNGGSALVIYKGHSDAVNSVAWSPDSTRIASGSVDKTVQVWDASTGKHLLTYKGHSDHATGVAWSPDSRHIASGSWDHTAQVWDATSGVLLVTYKGHSDHVTGVAWSTDGTRIASGSVDKTIQVWKVF
jgi:WD40 repeat protein